MIFRPVKYSWQVKFNDEIIYYRHLTYYIHSVNPKMFIVSEEHDILTFSLLHVNNQDLTHTLHTSTAGSINVALALGIEQ